jgi:Icc-related predicted phosphoesterase
VKFGKYNFVGYKWTKLNRYEEDHKIDIKKLKKLVNRRTILVTHEPAFGILDGSDDKDAIHLGSKYLQKMIDRKKPRLHLFGHTHRQFGFVGKFINGAYPRVKKFVSIDTELNKIKFIDNSKDNK